MVGQTKNQIVQRFGPVLLRPHGLWASVRSTFTADKRTGQLVIERKILFWTKRATFDAHTIERVFVRNTQKGSGSTCASKDGHIKKLSSSLELCLDEQAIALNVMLHIHHER